jgi:hypothetical protein
MNQISSEERETSPYSLAKNMQISPLRNSYEFQLVMRSSGDEDGEYAK